ncbi:hypothetical protein Hanom_Chr16g01462651 [Helianthus anomalus]
MMCEFLASFDFAPRPAEQPEEDEDPEHPWVKVSFRLGGGGVWHRMSLREFVVHTGFFTLEEIESPLYTEAVHELPRSTLVRF